MNRCGIYKCVWTMDNYIKSVLEGLWNEKAREKSSRGKKAIAVYEWLQMHTNKSNLLLPTIRSEKRQKRKGIWLKMLGIWTKKSLDILTQSLYLFLWERWNPKTFFDQARNRLQAVLVTRVNQPKEAFDNASSSFILRVDKPSSNDWRVDRLCCTA